MNEDLIQLIIAAFFVLAPLMLGLFMGGHLERKHLRSLDEREMETNNVIVSQIRSFPGIDPSMTERLPPKIVAAEVCISSDYLKTFLAFFRGFLGGEIRDYTRIMERARREAILRMKEEAQQLGYNAICNVRMETVDLVGINSNSKNKIVCASILATCTAYRLVE